MSNSSSILAYSLSAIVGLGGTMQGAEEGTAALTRRIERLEKQNAALKASYAQARIDADNANAQLLDIRSRLEALGGAALGNSEERLIQAMANIEVLSDRIQRLEQASVKLSGAILAYMKQAISEERTPEQQWKAPCACWIPCSDTGNSPCEMAREPRRKPRCSASTPSPEWWWSTSENPPGCKSGCHCC